MVFESFSRKHTATTVATETAVEAGPPMIRSLLNSNSRFLRHSLYIRPRRVLTLVLFFWLRNLNSSPSRALDLNRNQNPWSPSVLRLTLFSPNALSAPGRPNSSSDQPWYFVRPCLLRPCTNITHVHPRASVPRPALSLPFQCLITPAWFPNLAAAGGGGGGSKPNKTFLKIFLFLFEIQESFRPAPAGAYSERINNCYLRGSALIMYLPVPQAKRFHVSARRLTNQWVIQSPCYGDPALEVGWAGATVHHDFGSLLEDE